MNKLLSAALFLLLSTTLFAQQNRQGHHRQELTQVGFVLSADDDQPIPYATVIAKGTNNYTTTDDTGKFSINVYRSDTLVISFMGYHTAEVTTDINPLQIKLQPSAFTMGEVVVTALGIKRSPRELGSATEVLSNKQLNEGAPVNPLTGLTGRVAGLRVNMFDSKVDPNIQVVMRGSRSLTGDNSPMYVVDGVPVPNINRLNSNDIESVTVLKGANSAALYGSEGVNGALIITTKSGSGKGTINFKQTTTFSNVCLIPKAQTEFGQGIDGVYSPTDYASWGPSFDGTMKDFGTVLPNGTQPQVLYAAPNKDVRYDLFDTGLNMQNDLSFSKKTDNGSYFMSLQNVTIKGIIPNDKSSRNGIRFNTTQNFGKLRVASNLNYSYTSTETTPDGPWISMYKMPANFPLSEMKNWQDENSLGNPGNFFTTTVKNPYFLIDSYRNKSEQQLINGKVEFEYQFTSWLKAMYRLGLYSSTTQTRNTVARYDSKRSGASVQGSVADGSSNFRRLNGDFILIANKEFGKFRVSGILGQNFRDDYTKNVNLAASNLLFSDLFNQGSRIGNLGGTSRIARERQLAIYGEATVGYDNYLFVTVTGRNDWTSLLNPDNRSYFYPGVSGSFIFSDAISALKDAEVLSFGKIYTSYNKTGNINLTPYALALAYSQSGGFPYGDLVGFIPSSKNPNREIKPEFVRSFEIGTQLGFFNHRLNVDFAYVYSNSEGQIFAATSSAATGYTTTMVNLGELENNIWEFSIDGDIIRSPDIRWNVGVNYTYIDNKVKDLYGSGEAEEYNIFRQSYAIKGRAYPSLKVTDYARDPQGRIIVDAVTGLPSAAAAPTYKGTMVPPHQIGLQTSFRYKNLSIYADFDCRLGGWMYSELINAMIQAGTHPMTTEYGRKEFIIPNSVIAQTDAQGNTTYAPNTNIVAKGSDKSSYWNKYVAGYSVNYAVPSDYLKMRTLSIKYTLPDAAMRKIGFVKKITVGAEATNLFVIRHRDNDMGDPEYLYNNTAGYSSFRQVPPYRTFGFSINAIF